MLRNAHQLQANSHSSAVCEAMLAWTAGCCSPTSTSLMLSCCRSLFDSKDRPVPPLLDSTASTAQRRPAICKMGAYYCTIEENTPCFASLRTCKVRSSPVFLGALHPATDSFRDLLCPHNKIEPWFPTACCCMPRSAFPLLLHLGNLGFHAFLPSHA